MNNYRYVFECDELIEKMNIELVWYNGEYMVDVESLKEKMFVYVLKNANTFYVGMTTNIISRLTKHTHRNHIITENEGEVYILEQVYTEKQMRKMENVWIIWFDKHLNCENRIKGYCNMTNGYIRKCDLIDTRYKYLIDERVITKLEYEMLDS